MVRDTARNTDVYYGIAGSILPFGFLDFISRFKIKEILSIVSYCFKQLLVSANDKVVELNARLNKRRIT